MQVSPFRAAGYQGAGSILSAALQHFADACQPAFGDGGCTVELDVTASGATAGSLFKSVADGSREVAYMASGYLSAQVSELGVLDLPFNVSDRGAALASLDGEAGAMLQAAVAAKTGLRILGFWDNGFRHVSNGVRPLRTPADCAGLVCRTLDSALYRASLDAIGFTARTTDVQQLKQVVATREVDAQENPLTNSINFELWKYHPHMSLTGHFFGVLLLACNAKWFDGLSQSAQAAVQAAAREATLLQRERAAAEDARGMDFLASKGVQLVLPQDIDLAAMRECCAAVTAEACAGLPAPLVAAYGRR
ncbi:MAG: TRAP transporter substrate-binding protein [Pseudomonadota bacterium]